MGQDRLGPSCFFISLVLGPLNSLLWYVPSKRYIWSLTSIFLDPYRPGGWVLHQPPWSFGFDSQPRDHLVVGSCTSHSGVLGSIPKREEQGGKTGAPCVKVPCSSRVPRHSTVLAHPVCLFVCVIAASFPCAHPLLPSSDRSAGQCYLPCTRAPCVPVCVCHRCLLPLRAPLAPILSQVRRTVLPAQS